MIGSAITSAPGLRLFPVPGSRLGQVHPPVRALWCGPSLPPSAVMTEESA